MGQRYPILGGLYQDFLATPYSFQQVEASETQCLEGSSWHARTNRWEGRIDNHSRTLSKDGQRKLACDPALDREQLPHFLLLPLVENALKYGRATSPDRVGFRLAARRGGDGALVLEVANTGEWVEPTAVKNIPSLGIGLDNLRERLARYYPRSHELVISHAKGWVTVTLHLTANRLETRGG